jgi:predicted TIM-barrel enzyme
MVNTASRLFAYGLLAVLPSLSACASASKKTPAPEKEKTVNATAFTHPREKLRKISPRKKQIWVVGYVNSTLEDSFKDLEASRAGGADAIVYEGKDFKKLEETIAAVQKKYPDFPLGVNFLGGDDNLHSYAQTFEIARKLRLALAWTDFSGVDLIKEAPEVSLHAIEAQRPETAFYFSGIHMKYSTLLDPAKTIEKSALQAMGWVDGIVVTGPKTGVATDPERARRARAVIGDYPMGAASGVSAENVHTILPYVDYVIVNTSISDKNHRILVDKVRELRKAMDR